MADKELTDTEILSQMLREEMLQPVQKRSVELHETQAPDSRVTIIKMPQDAVVIKPDKFIAPKQVFRNSRHECKRADYAIISEQKKRIVYIEMKSSNACDGKEDVEMQLLGAKCFIAYCKEIGTGFWKGDKFLKGYQERFILFTHTVVETRNTRLSRNSRRYASADNDKPESYLPIPRQSFVKFDDIAG